jgi:hypothetical protein
MDLLFKHGYLALQRSNVRSIFVRCALKAIQLGFDLFASDAGYFDFQDSGDIWHAPYFAFNLGEPRMSVRGSLRNGVDSMCRSLSTSSFIAPRAAGRD